MPTPTATAARFPTEYGQTPETLAETLPWDEVAERIRSLGFPAEASLAGFVKAARLKERVGPAPDAKAMLTGLLADHEALARSLRPDVDAAQSEHGDAGTADFLTGLLEAHEKTAWMLRATLA